MIPMQVTLVIPASPDFLRLARLASTDAGSRAGFDYEEIDDLRMAVSELCHLVIGEGSGGSVTLRFEIGPDDVSVDGHASGSTRRRRPGTSSRRSSSTRSRTSTRSTTSPTASASGSSSTGTPRTPDRGARIGAVPREPGPGCRIGLWTSTIRHRRHRRAGRVGEPADAVVPAARRPPNTSRRDFSRSAMAARLPASSSLVSASVGGQISDEEELESGESGIVRIHVGVADVEVVVGREPGRGPRAGGASRLRTRRRARCSSHSAAWSERVRSEAEPTTWPRRVPGTGRARP